MACLCPRVYRVGRNLKKTILGPCGKCLGCLEDKQKDWSFRILQESLDYVGRTWFVRLSYRDSSLVYGSQVPTLYKPHLSLFIRYVRRVTECRFFACGEYGDEKNRPHYHVILFLKEQMSKYDVINLVESCWHHGFTNVKYFNPKHAYYCAKYTVKSALYEDLEGLKEPFFLMSRRPGIGYKYVEKFKALGLNPLLHCPRDLQGRPFRWSRFLRDKCFTDSQKVLQRAILAGRSRLLENKLLSQMGREYYRYIDNKQVFNYEQKYFFSRFKFR